MLYIQKIMQYHNVIFFFLNSGSPIIATLPHFYKSEDYVNDVTGLNPNENEHSIKMFFEPVNELIFYQLFRY